MRLPLIINQISSQEQINNILELNKETIAYGLKLNKKEIMQIIEMRNRILKGYGRIELGTTVIDKLIKSFYNSPYIEQDMYMETLIEIQEIFYYMKNETEDKISDDELIDIIKDFFENHCKGSIELLQGREIESFARNQRIEYQKYDFYLGKDEF
jgi:hypothetical protein